MNAGAKQLTIGIGMAGAGAFVSELKKPEELKDFLGYGLMVTGFGQVVEGIRKIRMLEQARAIYQGN